MNRGRGLDDVGFAVCVRLGARLPRAAGAPGAAGPRPCGRPYLRQYSLQCRERRLARAGPVSARRRFLYSGKDQTRGLPSQ